MFEFGSVAGDWGEAEGTGVRTTSQDITFIKPFGGG